MAYLKQGTPEARGLGNAAQLGSKIAKAMNNLGTQNKKNTRSSTQGQSRSMIGLPNQGKSSISVIPSHRYRRYFGIRAPGSF